MFNYIQAPFLKVSQKDINNGSFQEDLALLVKHIVRQAKEILVHWNQYISYCKKNKILFPHRGIQFIYNHLKETISFLKDIQTKVKKHPIHSSGLIKIESELRVIIQSLAFIESSFNWKSPSYAQCQISQFFSLEDQEKKRINYERMNHKEVERIEKQLLKTFGLSDEMFCCTVTSSGMAALCLVEAFLSRKTLKPGDTIVITPYSYFEFRKHLKSLTWINVIESESYDIEEIIQLVETNEAKALFLDILTNTATQRMIDVEKLLKYFSDHRYCPSIVVDGTMLSCAVIPYINSFAQNKNIFYIESCSKYLQLGLDMSLAGVILHSAEWTNQMQLFRTNMGSILTEYQACLFPLYKQCQMINRLARIESNALNIASALSSDLAFEKRCRIIYPGLSNHPDFQIAKKLNRFGGCIVFEFPIHDKESYSKEMKRLINILLTHARDMNIPISEGFSFGFSAPRVNTDIPIHDITESDREKLAYLQLYVGDQHHLNQLLIQLMKVTFEEYLL